MTGRAGLLSAGVLAGLIVAAAALACVLPPGPAGALGAQPACSFTAGFKALHDRIPEVVGDCLEDEGYNPDSGNVEQRTTRGLLAWRQADNLTTFTDGTTTWLIGPEGLVSRANNDRPFAWESSGGEPTGAPRDGCRDRFSPCAPPAPPPPPPIVVPPQPAGSGVEGRVTVAPTCPGPIQPGQVCEQSYQGLLTIVDPSGQFVTRAQTDDLGRFRVDIAPGDYVIRPEPPGRFMSAQEHPVTVTTGQYTQVRITYDTGLR